MIIFRSLYALNLLPLTSNLMTPESNHVQQPITSAPPEIKEIIQQVLQLEKDKLYLKTPRNINEDILNIIKQVIQ